MRVKTSITLRREQLEALDAISKNRSRAIEQAVDAFLAQHAKAARYASELQRMKRTARKVNAEMADVLAAQGALWD